MDLAVQNGQHTPESLERLVRVRFHFEIQRNCGGTKQEIGSNGPDSLCGMGGLTSDFHVKHGIHDICPSASLLVAHTGSQTLLLWVYQAAGQECKKNDLWKENTVLENKTYCECVMQVEAGQQIVCLACLL